MVIQNQIVEFRRKHSKFKFSQISINNLLLILNLTQIMRGFFKWSRNKILLNQLLTLKNLQLKIIRLKSLKLFMEIINVIGLKDF